ncbi:metal-sulfur cluster assembly factor [Lactobacillus reuteri]|uniref:metal-sulfur cluster assembly factor n=1 Tax=Limosilactobacillus reuteri TaxID=1598 RepID=UPI0016521250|nr:metal-sulfur cluster assembly factor [Limosilactobacillus reuteri]MBC6911749.1 metal-sulfur cluster assembly factor [Limosilactobacillus reuteri]MDD1406578.1 metal-sulfur cluster assembly factor [Limosilactobacillus reuteri]
MRDKQSIKDDIVQRLATVIDPELHIDIVNLGLVYTIDLDNDGICLIEMTLTTMGCPLTNVLADMVTKAVKEVPEVKNVDVEFVWEPAWTIDRMTRFAKLSLGVH